MELKFKKFQEGGAVTPDQGGAQPIPDQGIDQGSQEQDPTSQLIEAAAQAVQSQDCQIALQVCQVLVQLAQQGAGGAPEESPADEGEPVYRQGGKLSRRIKK